jgi:hypothetical protein
MIGFFGDNKAQAADDFLLGYAHIFTEIGKQKSSRRLPNGGYVIWEQKSWVPSGSSVDCIVAMDLALRKRSPKRFSSSVRVSRASMFNFPRRARLVGRMLESWNPSTLLAFARWQRDLKNALRLAIPNISTSLAAPETWTSFGRPDAFSPACGAFAMAQYEPRTESRICERRGEPNHKQTKGEHSAYPHEES